MDSCDSHGRSNWYDVVGRVERSAGVSVYSQHTMPIPLYIDEVTMLFG